MVYNFIRKKNDNSLSYDDTVVFLGPTVDPYDAYDGGAIYYCYIGPSVQPTGVSGEYAFRVSDGSRVVLGKGMQIDTSDPQYNATYNLRMDVHSTLRSTRALSFSGDGEIDFSPANSYGKPGRVDKIKYSTPEQMIEVRNVADTTVWGDIDPSVTGIPPADGDVDASAYGIESTGILRVISNMSAFIAAKSAVTLCPYYVLKVLLYRNPSSDNLSMAVAIRADSLQIDGNFTGVLKSTNSFQVSNSELDKLRLNDNSIYDNAIGSYGICADKEITISGEYCGRIYSDITDVSIVNDVAELAAKAKNYPVVSYNTVVANGIYGGGITFGAPVLGRIYASVNDVTISAESNDANYPARVASNSVDCYAIRSSGDIVFNDAFEAILSSQVDNIQIKSINRPGVSEPRLVANNITAVGIYTYDDIIAKKNFGGEIVVDLSTDPYDDVALLEIRVAALHASNISVINGYLRSSISIESFYDIDISSEYNDESYVCGVFADTLTAAGFAGDIGVHAKTVTGGSSVSGFLINDYLANGNDEIFDFAGTIWVDSKDRAFGIMGSTARAMNIRISGSVDSPKYAVVAGRYSSNSPDFVLSGFDDTVEIAAGAYVAGDIELGDGINKVIIDSNARLKGDILNTNGYGTPVGMTDIEFLLNDHPFEINGVPIQAPSQYKNDAIIEINNRTYNPSRLNINLNLNDVDLSGGPRTYKLVHGENMTAWQNETLGINYQNLRCLVSVGQVISYEGIEIETSIVDGSLMLTVNALPAVSAEKPSAITGLTESVNHNAETVILSWDNAGYQGSCDVEYRIGGGKTFVQKTQNGDNSITLSNITEKQTVEWRVRKNQNSGGRNFTSDWSYGNKVTMAAADYVYSKVTDTYAEFTGFAGTDLTANLTWSKGATYSEGVKGYAVRYFQSRRPVNGAIDWENTAVMTKEVTAPELLIAGLNTDQYLYWQVQAVDKIDGSSDSLQINPDNWVDGETVIYNPDTTDPTFTNGQSAILDSSIYWADPTTIGSNETHTMDPYLRWAYAQDDNLGVGSYKLSIREQSQTPGAGNAWTTFEIPVISILQIAFNFRLSDWIAQNPGTQMKLLENATYEWSLIAEDYAGNQSTALTGAWVKNAEVPILDASAVLSNTEWMGGDKPLRANIVWDAAQDNNPPTLRYELQYRLSGSSGSWTTKTISVKDSLSWAVDLANSDWEYKLTAYNVAGNASNTVTGTWYADNVAPVFVDASKVKASDAYDAITKNNTITFTWSNASDNSATRPKSSAVSGVDHFVLSFVDSDGKRQTLGNFAYDASKTIYTYTTTSDALKLPEGYYNWKVEAYDKAGNVVEVAGNQFVIGIDYKNTVAPTFANGQSAILNNSIYWADPTKIDSNETHTMDPYLKWASATDDKDQMKCYKLSIREKSQTPGAENAWTTFEIPVTDATQTTFEFRLSDWIAKNPGVQMELLENATYEWSLIAEDHAGNQSAALTGSWAKETENPTLNGADVISNTEWTGGSTPLHATIMWNAAQDNDPPTLRYELQYRLADSSDSWTTKTISVKDSLSWSGDLANSDWEYKLTAYNAAGNASNTITGTWYGDNAAPTLVDASKFKVIEKYDLTTKNSTITFTWSNAADNSATRPNSGVDHIVLYVKSLNNDGDTRILDSFAYNASKTTYTYMTTSDALKLPDGNYTCYLELYDKAGNCVEVAGNQFIIGIDGDNTIAPTFPNGQSTVLASNVYWADPTTIGSNETHTMDPYLKWASATDDKDQMKCYKLSIREKSQTPGAENAWTTFEIPVNNITQATFEFRLSDWIAKNPGTQMELLENAAYEWSLIAEDYAGNQSAALTGSWAKDTENPTLNGADVISNTEWTGGSTPLHATIMWNAAQDNDPPTLRYELQYRLADSSDNWTTKTISVKDSLSWAVDLANSDWEYKLTAYNAAGNASNTVTGTWYADNVAPVFVDATKVKASDAYDAITKNNTITFTWSNASDNSATRPKGSAVSGVDHFVLSFVDSDGNRQTLGNFVYDATKTTYTYTTTSDALKLPDGYYDWQIEAYDKAGNVVEVAGNQFLIGIDGDNTTAPTFPNGQSAILNSSIYWADPTMIGSNETHTMDPYLKWASATDDKDQMSCYKLSIREKSQTPGAENVWTTFEIPVTDATQTTFEFRLSDWIAKNPGTQMELLENATYEWSLIAEDYAGNQSVALTGSWAKDTENPTLNGADVISNTEWTGGSTPLHATIMWNAAQDNDPPTLRYELQYRLAGSSGSWTTKTISVKDSLSWAVDLANSDWEYKLTAYNAAGNASNTVTGTWLADNVAPIFVDETNVEVSNTYDLTTQNNTLTFTWSNAEDKSASRPNSGVDHFVLSLSDLDGNRHILGNIVHDASKDSYTHTTTVGLNGALKLPEGNYDWRIEAHDKAGNVVGVAGNQITIDTDAPTGQIFNLRKNGLITYRPGDNISELRENVQFGLPLGSPVTPAGSENDIISLYCDFSFNSTYVDNLGAMKYVFQICDNAAFTGDRFYEFISDYTSLHLSDKNGFGVGAIANTPTNEVHWRVMAMDSKGNRTGDWFNGDVFIMTAEGMPGYITDTDAPTNIVSIIGGQETDGVYLTWDASYDLFGVDKYQIRYTLTGGDTKTFSVSATETSTVLTSLADGDYTWSVRAVDYVGHTSDWFPQSIAKFTVDTVAPVWKNGANLRVATVHESRDLTFTWNKADDKNLIGYFLTITKKSDSGDVTERVNIYDPSATSYVLRDQDNGNYEYTIHAQDLFDNVSASSNKVTATVNVSNDAGQTFETAKTLSWGATDQQTVGVGDSADFFTGEFSGAAKLNITISDLTNLNGKKSGGKLLIYRADDHKLKKSYKLKLGTTSISGLLWDINKYGGRYYAKVISSNKKDVIQYKITASQNLFEKSSKNTDFGSAVPLTLDAAGKGEFTNGWVGFGDKDDYYKFTTADNGAIKMNMTMRQQNPHTKYKVALYNAAGKKLKSVTLNGDLGKVTDIFTKDVLALKGTYYVKISSAKPDKGTQNGYYDFTINDNYFINEYESDDGKSFTVKDSINTSISGWVGFGDAADTYLLDAKAGSYSVSINGVSAKLKVTLRDAATGKKVKSWSVTEANKLLLDHSLLKGKTYLEVKASDNGKGKQNSDYTVNIVANEILPKATNNNDLASATTVNFGKAKSINLQDEWVGYGDSADFFGFQLDSASKVDLNLDLANKQLQLGKDVKVKLYNAATGKSVKLDAGLTTLDTLEAGKYAVSVDMLKTERNWSAYDLGISKIA